MIWADGADATVVPLPIGRGALWEVALCGIARGSAPTIESSAIAAIRLMSELHLRVPTAKFESTNLAAHPDQFTCERDGHGRGADQRIVLAMLQVQIPRECARAFRTQLEARD